MNAIRMRGGRRKQINRFIISDLEVLYTRVTKHLKPATRANDRINWDRHILPGLGLRKVESLKPSVIRRWHQKVGSKSPIQANRALQLLSGAINIAAQEGKYEGWNPCTVVKRFREEPRRRYLDDEELARLHNGLDELEPENPKAVLLIRLLLYTGARLREILTAEWEWIDGAKLKLPDSKTGGKVVFLPPPALELLRSNPRQRGLIFYSVGSMWSKPMAPPYRFWKKVLERAEIKDFRLHDLRHTFAARALAGGVSLAIVGELLGHASERTTKRYVHLIDATGHEAAEIAAGRLLPTT